MLKGKKDVAKDSLFETKTSQVLFRIFSDFPPPQEGSEKVPVASYPTIILRHIIINNNNTVIIITINL